MSTYGTSHFVSYEAAIRYYLEYNPELKPSLVGKTLLAYTQRKNEDKRKRIEEIIQEKLDDGSINIGRPLTRPNDEAFINHEEGRWFITEHRWSIQENTNSKNE